MVFRAVRDIHDKFLNVSHPATAAMRRRDAACGLTLSGKHTDWAFAFIAGGGYLRAHGPAAARASKALMRSAACGSARAWRRGEDIERLLFETSEEAGIDSAWTPPVRTEAVP